MITVQELNSRLGKIGWVYPNGWTKTATIAVKVVGVNMSYGEKLLVIEPLAGTGSWQVKWSAVEFGGADE